MLATAPASCRAPAALRSDRAARAKAIEKQDRRARSALHRRPNGSRRQVEGAPRDRDRQRRGIESRRRPARPQHIADIDERRDRDRREYDERQQKLTALLAPTTAQMPAALLADVNRGHERRSALRISCRSSVLHNQASPCP